MSGYYQARDERPKKSSHFHRDIQVPVETLNLGSEESGGVSQQQQLRPLHKSRFRHEHHHTGPTISAGASSSSRTLQNASRGFRHVEPPAAAIRRLPPAAIPQTGSPIPHDQNDFCHFYHQPTPLAHPKPVNASSLMQQQQPSVGGGASMAEHQHRRGNNHGPPISLETRRLLQEVENIKARRFREEKEEEFQLHSLQHQLDSRTEGDLGPVGRTTSSKSSLLSTAASASLDKKKKKKERKERRLLQEAAARVERDFEYECLSNSSSEKENQKKRDGGGEASAATAVDEPPSSLATLDDVSQLKSWTLSKADSAENGGETRRKTKRKIKAFTGGKGEEKGEGAEEEETLEKESGSEQKKKNTRPAKRKSPAADEAYSPPKDGEDNGAVTIKSPRLQVQEIGIQADPKEIWKETKAARSSRALEKKNNKMVSSNNLRDAGRGRGSHKKGAQRQSWPFNASGIQVPNPFHGRTVSAEPKSERETVRVHPRRAKSEEKEKYQADPESMEIECRKQMRERRSREKPWRTNMIRKPTDEEKKGERGMGTSAGGKEGTNDKEDVKKGRREEEGEEGEDNNKTKRPWREGMKKSCSQEEMKKERDGSGGPISCDRRHHNEVGGVGSRPSAEEEGGRRPDGDKIREFMQQRRDKAKEEAKRAEREMEERKAVIKQRLLDLEIKRREEYKLQVQKARREQKKKKEKGERDHEGMTLTTTTSKLRPPPAEQAKETLAMKTKQLHKLNRKTEEEIFLRRRLEELTKEMRQNRHIFMQQAAKEATEKTTAVSIAGKNKETSQKEEQKQQKICTPEKNKAQKPAADSRDVYKELERLRKENDKLQKMAQKFMTGKPSSTVAVSAPSSTAAAAPTLTKPVSVAAVQNYVSAELDQVVPVPKAVKSKKQLSTEKAENLIQKQSSAEMMARPSADKGQQTTTRITEYHQAQSNPRHEIPTGEDVPVRDTSNSIPQGSDKLKRIVSEIFARHQSDLVYIKNSNLGIELPQPQQLLQNFSSGQQPTQQLRSSMTEQPKNVNRTNIRAKASHGLTDSEEEAAAPPRLINVNSPDPDPFNFIATVKRKMPNFDSGTKEVEKGKNSGKKRQPAAVKQGDKDGSDLTISEGPLSTSFASSAAAAAAAAGANDALAKKLKKAKKKKKEKQQRKSFVPSPLPPEPNINDVNVGASTSKGLAAETSQQPMVRPEALRLRFMAEMQQMDTIQQVESHIRQIKQIKDVHTAKHEASDMARYIQALKASLAEAKLAKKSETRSEFEARMKNEFQEIISTKMHKLLEQQTEATKVTADAAKQLAKLQQTHELADSKRQQPMVDVSELAKAIRNAQESSHQPLPAVSMTKLVPKVSNVAKSLPKAVQSTKDQPIQPDFLMSKELKSLISKTDSNVPEIMSAIEGTQSISKTISEALDNLNSDKSNNISEDVAEDLNTDYSSKFDDVDESTIKEIASNSELKVSSEIKTDSVTSSRSNCESSPKSSVIKNASEGAAKKSTPVRGPSASPSTQYNYSEDDTFSEGTGLTESKLLAPDASNLSVFSEGESFNRFTIQMHKQHLEEESLRSKHQYGLLKKKESDLIGKVKEELTALQEQRKRLKESGAEGGEDKISAIKKKERAILLELKTRRSEINRLKQSIKVAEKERKLIMQQQKKLLKQQRPTRSGSSSKEDQDTVSSHTLTDKTQNSEEKTPKERVSASDSVHTEDSESQRSNSISKDLKAAERQIMQGIRKLERNKKYLNEKESSVLDKTKHLGKLIQSKQLRPSDDTSSDSSSIHEDAKTESDSFDKGSAVSVTSPSKMESLKKSIGTTLKTPLSPKLRRRHSSADSDDSLSVSQPETMSDHSDVEIRITTLQDELKRRMMTAAKLKKQQRSKSKEKLRIKEVALKKQIEKYDKLILETKADLEEPGAGEVVQPQIKTPYKQPSSPHDIARKASTESVTVSESISSAPPSPAPAASPLPNREPPQPLHEEDRTVSCESSVDTILSNKEISEDIPASNTGGGQSYDRSYTADFTETPEVEEEEVKYLPERSRTPTPQATTKSVQEDEHSDLNYSDDFTSSSAASDAGGSDINPLQQQVLSVTVTEKKTTETKSGARNLAANLTAASKNLCREERVEKVAGDILDALVTDTCDKYKEVSKTFKTTTNVTDIKDGGVDLGDESSLSKTSPKTPSISPSAARKPSPPPCSVISPRSRPQDLMLSTFDISSDSSDEDRTRQGKGDDEDKGDTDPRTGTTAGILSPAPSLNIPIDLGDQSDEADVAGECEGNFIDDDFGLSSIEKESERLKRQEQQIEEEIKRIQQESSLVAPLVVPGSVVPDKPPPPYTPPASNTSTSSHSKPPRPAQPKPTQKYVPGSKDEIFKIAAVMVRDIYDAKEKRREFKENVIIDHAKSVVTDLPEKGHTSFDKFIKFLFDLVSETVADVFKWELETQNPPWMPQKSLATEKRKLPKSEAQLLERVKREISIYFGYEKRSQKENLIVRWSQKRRDRVDQILVRELHAEEQSWTDYHKDETMVKDQLTDTMVKILLDNTTKELIKVLKK